MTLHGKYLLNFYETFTLQSNLTKCFSTQTNLQAMKYVVCVLKGRVTLQANTDYPQHSALSATSVLCYGPRKAAAHIIKAKSFPMV